MAAARAATRLVLPTPGLPSSSTAFLSCRARSTRSALLAVVGALKSKGAALGGVGWGPRSTKNGGMPHRLSAICFWPASLPTSHEVER